MTAMLAARSVQLSLTAGPGIDDVAQLTLVVIALLDLSPFDVVLPCSSDQR